MSLFESRMGKKYIVNEIIEKEEVGRRLEALGINEGTIVSVLNKKKNGAIIIKVRGVRLAIGKAISTGIFVSEVNMDNGSSDKERG